MSETESSSRLEGDAILIAEANRLCAALMDLGQGVHPMQMVDAMAAMLVGYAGNLPSYRGVIIDVLERQTESVRAMGDLPAAQMAELMRAKAEQFEALAAMPLPVAGH